MKPTLVLVCLVFAFLTGCKPRLDSPNAGERYRAVVAPGFTDQTVVRMPLACSRGWLRGREMQIATIGLGHNNHLTCVPVEGLVEKPVDFEILDEKGCLVSMKNRTSSR